MQHLLSGIPEAFIQTVAYGDWQPLEDAPMKYWSMQRNGKPLADCECQIWGYPVIQRLLGPYYTQDGDEIQLPDCGPYERSFHYLDSGTLFRYDWDGQKLTVTLEPKEHYKYTELLCGWDAVLVATPVLDHRLTDFLDQVEYKLRKGPYLEHVKRQPLELVALSVADYKYKLSNHEGASMSADFEKYKTLTEGLTEGQKETITALALEWKGNAESLALAARKL